MICRLRVLLLTASLATLLGCGASPTPPVSASPYLNLNGNWEAVGLSPAGSGAILTTPIADFTGALQSSGGTVTGTLRAFDASNFLNPCVSFSQDLAASGTLSPTGALVLTVPISGGTATITAQLASNLESFSPASWQIVGGACAMPSTISVLSQFAPLTGTYTGTLTSVTTPSVTATITATLTQSTTADADGRFPLTGTVASQGACSATLPIVGEIVSGNGIFAPPLIVNPYTPAVVNGSFLSTAATIQAFIQLFPALPTTCQATYFSGILTRQ